MFFCVRRVAGVSALFSPVAGLRLLRAVLPLYMFALAILGRPSLCLPVAGCRLSVLSVLSVCLCVPVSVAGFHPVAGRVLRAVAVCLYPCQAVEQVFD